MKYFGDWFEPAAFRQSSWRAAGVNAAPVFAALFLFALCSSAGTFVSELRSDEEILFYPTLAAPATNGGWDVHIQGCVFEVEGRRLSLGVLLAVLRLDRIRMSACEQATFEERARLFFADNERGHRVIARVDGKTFDLGRSAPNGHFEKQIHLDSLPVATSSTDLKVLESPLCSRRATRGSSPVASWCCPKSA
jgi:hypothetical protein